MYVWKREDNDDAKKAIKVRFEHLQIKFTFSIRECYLFPNCDCDQRTTQAHTHKRERDRRTDRRNHFIHIHDISLCHTIRSVEQRQRIWIYDDKITENSHLPLSFETLQNTALFVTIVCTPSTSIATATAAANTEKSERALTINPQSIFLSNYRK